MSCTDKEYLKPVSPDASREAIQLYNYLQDIAGKKTLTGQHNYISTGNKYTELIREITGKTPVVWGSDFSFCVEGEDFADFQHCGPLNLSDPMDRAYFTGADVAETRQKMINTVIQMHKKGHIITLMWHGCPPPEGDCCKGSSIWAYDNRPGQEEWMELTTEGTELNKAWKKQADPVAGYLKQLQDARVPVLWRPCHEMNGIWFWWCNHPGEEGFKRLWIMMYDYFTKHHKLNNLLWVWNTNAPRETPGDEAYDYELFFPGLEYVDVLAADVYHNDYKQSHHDDLLGLAGGKPIALAEVGNIPTDSILKAQPCWTWFMSWGYLPIKYDGEEKIKVLYGSDKVVSLE